MPTGVSCDCGLESSNKAVRVLHVTFSIKFHFHEENKRMRERLVWIADLEQHFCQSRGQPIMLDHTWPTHSKLNLVGSPD